MSVGRLFAGFSALAPNDRFELAILLLPAHRLFPTTDAEFAALPAPSSGVVTRQFLARLTLALSRSVDGPLATWPMGALIPGLTDLHTAVETSPDVTNRLLALVRAQGRRWWSELADQTVGEIRSWNGAGASLTSRLIAAAVEALLRAEEPETPEVGLFAAAPAVDPSVASALFDSTGSETSTEVGRRSVTIALDACLSGIRDPRARIAFELDDLRLDEPNGLRSARAQATAELVGTSYDTVAQWKFSARRKARELRLHDDAIGAAVDDLAARLDELTDRPTIDTALADLALAPIDDPSGLLAVYLAGPLRPVPGHLGWWSPRPTELVAQTAKLLASDGGVHHHDALVADLGRLGIPDELVDSWLTVQPVRRQDDLVILLSGRPADIAGRALDATGRAMSWDELRDWMPSVGSRAVLAAELHRDRRFIQTDPDRWELTEWGGEPSTHLPRFRIHVTSEALIGDEVDAPGELVGMLGLPVGKRATIATRFGPLSLTYDGTRVVRGSARPILLACGASVGDVLIIVIDSAGRSGEVELERNSPGPELPLIYPPPDPDTGASPWNPPASKPH